jgi:GTP-sensing pleiotropic transcriptional regulator CodY
MFVKKNIVTKKIIYIAKNSLYFSSYNQEANLPVNSILQVSVTEEAKKFDKHLECISREKSWMRDGYIAQFHKVINTK